MKNSGALLNVKILFEFWTSVSSFFLRQFLLSAVQRIKFWIASTSSCYLKHLRLICEIAWFHSSKRMLFYRLKFVCLLWECSQINWISIELPFQRKCRSNECNMNWCIWNHKIISRLFLKLKLVRSSISRVNKNFFSKTHHKLWFIVSTKLLSGNSDLIKFRKEN